jgi:Rrf2 family protein
LLKIQKKIIYAIEAVVDIALNSGNGPVQNEEIAKRQGIPKRYLEQTLQVLVKKKILVGSRGPKGGYSLAKERRKVMIADIIKSVFNDKKISNNFSSDLSQKIIIPLINEVTENCYKKFMDISVEEICKIANEKKIQKNIPKRVDFDI